MHVCVYHIIYFGFLCVIKLSSKVTTLCIELVDVLLQLVLALLEVLHLLFQFSDGIGMLLLQISNTLLMFLVLGVHVTAKLVQLCLSLAVYFNLKTCCA